MKYVLCYGVALPLHEVLNFQPLFTYPWALVTLFSGRISSKWSTSFASYMKELNGCLWYLI